jgi:hypothetical protein
MPSRRYAPDVRTRRVHPTIKALTPIFSVSTSETVKECEAAMLTVIANKVQLVQKQGCVGVQSYSNHWPCLLPQHGLGHKHHRRIYLADWQKPIVQRHPGQLLRGLFHSDGCRITNRIRRGQKSYEYPRYNFSNESVDIIAMCQDSLNRLAVSWRMCRPNMLSVARREAVARLDEFVGPKW